MQATFAFPRRATSLSPSPLLGASRTYSATAAYDADADVRPIPYTQATIAALIKSNDLLILKSAVHDLTDYEASVRSYYDTRVNRTSGGKRDRLRDERAALCNEALAAIRLATVGINSVSARIAANVKAGLPAYTDTNALNASQGFTNQATVSSSTAVPVAASPYAKFILPGVAALAALFFLKGH